MEKLVFDKLMKHYTELHSTASKFAQVDLSNLVITDYNKVVQQAQTCQARLDRFNIDIYHIIGMGNLSASQLAKFSKLIKNIEANRSVVKNIASQKLVSLTPYTGESSFKLSCGLELNNN